MWVFFQPVAVGVAGEVHPHRGPAFAEARRGEQAVGGFFVGVRRWVGEESLQFLLGRREAGDVERGAAEPLLLGGLGGGGEFVFFEVREHISVHGLAAPILALRFRWFFFRGDVGPVLLILRALADPLLDQLDFLRFERVAGVVAVRGRHHMARVRRGDALHDLGIIGIAGDDDFFAVCGNPQRFVAVDKRHAGAFFHPAVAAGAGGVQNRADVAVEQNLAFGGGRRTRGGRDQNQECGGLQDFHLAWVCCGALEIVTGAPMTRTGWPMAAVNFCSRATAPAASMPVPAI